MISFITICANYKTPRYFDGTYFAFHVIFHTGPETIVPAVLTVDSSYGVDPGRCMSFIAIVEGEGR
jgi:hypothetical protein